jgi:hypothetical protein
MRGNAKVNTHAHMRDNTALGMPVPVHTDTSIGAPGLGSLEGTALGSTRKQHKIDDSPLTNRYYAPLGAEDERAALRGVSSTTSTLARRTWLVTDSSPVYAICMRR